MISKARIRRVQSLQDRKERDSQGLYVIEGDRLVREYLEAGYRIESVYAVSDWIRALPETSSWSIGEIVEVSERELARMSSLKTPHDVLGLVRKLEVSIAWEQLPSCLSIALDAVRDPGNFGTILRVAAWFGVGNVLASPDCVDPFNPKVIQAAMGATIHVRVHSVELVPLLDRAIELRVPIYGTALDGESLYDAPLAASALLLFGNEARGLAAPLLHRVTHRLTIPPWGSAAAGLDSLNVAMSAAIVCAEFRRREVCSGRATSAA
jgi:TrmH family RNA methyltransferase